MAEYLHLMYGYLDLMKHFISKVPVPLRLRSQYDCLNKVFALALICKLSKYKYKHIGKHFT